MALYAFDGTSNIDEEADIDDTNVVRFKELYDGDTCYLPGVGTRMGAIGKVLGGALGLGGRTRIEEMLEALQKNYIKGDTDIDVIGFSRGAALAVHFCNKVAEDGIKNKDGQTEIPAIRFLGLWDIVGSFGLSFDNIVDFQSINLGWDIDRVAPNVAQCSHAMALDERRETFNITRLNDKQDHAHIHECWFKGVHSDIGGGNKNVKRSNIALNWMLDEAIAAAVPIKTDKRNEHKYARSKDDLDSPISVNKDVKIDPKREVGSNDEYHESTKPIELAIGEQHSVRVYAEQRFNWSRVKLIKGQRYKISAEKDDHWSDDDIDCNATGWETEDLPFYKELVIKHFEGGRRVPAANWFELIGSYGNDDSDTFFRIGLEHKFTADETVELYTFANDLKSKYHNNYGYIIATIERLE